MERPPRWAGKAALCAALTTCALGSQACSDGVAFLGAKPKVESSGEPDSGLPSGTPGSEEEDSQEGSTLPEAPESAPDQLPSDTDETSSTGMPSPTQDSSSTSSTEDSSSPDTDSTAEEMCETWLCVSLNDSKSIGRSLWYRGRSRFSVTLPDLDVRLASIRLVGGYGVGTTTVRILEDNVPSSEVVFTEASWKISRPKSQGWDGGNFDPIVEFPAKKKIWIETTPVGDSRASVSSGGKKVDLHYQRAGQTKWSKMRVPMMLQLYCCVD